MRIIDFETYSSVSIDCGAIKYASQPTADIVCLGYKIDDRPVQWWMPGRPLPPELIEPNVTYAHNAAFDYVIWHMLGPRYGFPELPITEWRDTQALANRYTYPGALDKVGAILNLKVQKDRRGKQLMKKISNPRADGSRPKLKRDFTQQDLIDYVRYCMDDVESTYHLIKALPSDSLTPREQQYWELTQYMNMNGLPVDIESADKILHYIKGYIDEMHHRLPILTSGRVTKATQTQRIVKWLNDQGVEIPNLQANTVEKYLEKDLSSDCKEVLELRAALGRSSTAKYLKLKELEFDGRVFFNLQYYGTSTGRWAGRGFQLHNLPRAKVKDPEAYIHLFNTFQPVEDPVNVAKALIRPMIYAEDGTHLIVTDYTAIENCILMWLARDWDAVQLLRDGMSQYIDMACYMYNCAPEEVTEFQRLIGKIIILGCGYGMGTDRFQEEAASWGVNLTWDESDFAVQSYRKKYRLIKNLWYKLKDCAVAAIQNPRRTYGFNGCAFKVVVDRNGRRWLQLRLPSSRNLYYSEPYIEEDKYGPSPGHWGINPYSKKWSRLRLIPGRITENIVQALARDIMAHGLYQVYINMPQITLLGTVHDESIGQVQDRFITSTLQSEYDNCLCTPEPWAELIPISAKGYIARRYRKD